MVALSMADGYARVTNKPQAVIVHVDVGTSALGAGLHNASVGRTPILILAGRCPITEDGSIRGSRTEYQHWIQDAPDQKAIVRQYCRWTGEIESNTTVRQIVGRALQFASSDVKGPVYVTGGREILAAEMNDDVGLDLEKWVPVGKAALPESAVETIVEALVGAERPLLITGYSGRNHDNPAELAKLADAIPGLRVHDTGGGDMCFPFSHPASLGMRYGSDKCTTDADVIIILDCDVPWVPARNAPRADTKIFHVDVDPLNNQIQNSLFPAHGRWRADSHTALRQLNNHIENSPGLQETLKREKYKSHCMQGS